MPSLKDKYQRKTDREHVLDNPDTYTGSMTPVEVDSYVLTNEGKICEKSIEIIPGLYKLFDEGVVNCRDHAVRMKQSSDPNDHKVSKIEVNISDDGIITLLNDGNGIDVAVHPEHNIWIPEMVFGHLRTSTNYDKTEKKIVGGKNGFGFKLVLIWSTWGKVETVDHKRGLKYVQEFHSNLTSIDKPSVTKCKVKPYTKVSFKPDYARLGIENLSTDMLSLLRRRAYDIAAITDKNVKVKLNDEWLTTKTFQQYVDLFLGPKAEFPRFHEDHGERWEYVVALAPKQEFTQVSFVNGIYTSKGGKHVDYIINQIIRKLAALIKKKKKVDVKPNTIKEQLILFLRCDIENPAFESQTKDYLSTPVANFGSSCTVSDKLIEKIAKMGVMDAACALTQVKDTQSAKKTDGTKSRMIKGIPKLIDANWAGTAKADRCTIILCEGDSAKAGIVSGLSKSDRDVIGVYPMRGKMFNVRGETAKRVSENKEVSEIKKILGLVAGQKYTPETIKSSLRYGNILFMTDQDLDGSHIKGLGINMFQSQWNSLTQVMGFIGFMNTPILKAQKGSTVVPFYSEGEYQNWCESNDSKGWKIKYYKGLGTSTGKEFREYFESKKVVTFKHGGDDCDDSIDMVFNKKRAEDRKEWLSKYDRSAFLDTELDSVTYTQFINREMIHFSKYDCDRSIPNLMDGLKTSQRKILYAGFKRNLTREVKVAQFSGYVSEHSGYHHGESSLNGAIVGMAQTFVGSNNINLFMPNGQFGTRLQGGKDSASERYIFTELSPMARRLYPASDDAILERKEDDGTMVEPVFYAPVIPMVLVNGSKGIGTGFSTDIASYNPLDVITYIRYKLSGPDGVCPSKMTPYWKGFKGTVTWLSHDDSKVLIRGCYEREGQNVIRVTELPIGFWTDDFKQHLENIMNPAPPAAGKTASSKTKSVIKEYADMSTDTLVDVRITFVAGAIDELLPNASGVAGVDGIEKLLKLTTTHSTTNMHAFNDQEQLRKFESAEEMADEYFTVRLGLYEKRRLYLLDILRKELTRVSNKAKYIQGNLNDEIDLRRKKQDEVNTMLSAFGLDKEDDSYKYLTRLPMDSVTHENVERLLSDKKEKEKQIADLTKATAISLWRQDLEACETEYRILLAEYNQQMTTSTEVPQKTKKKQKKVVLK